MTPANGKPSVGMAAVLALASVASLTGCQVQSTAPDSYQLTGAETVTDVSSGVRKQIEHWQYADGTMTQSTKVVFKPEAGRPPRGTRHVH